VGIENVEDLSADLERGLAVVPARVGSQVLGLRS